MKVEGLKNYPAPAIRGLEEDIRTLAVTFSDRTILEQLLTALLGT